jgi:hypothetical protein
MTPEPTTDAVTPLWSPENLQRLLQTPTGETLRCVEHHRQCQMAGLCPWCVLRRIEERLRDGYGLMPATRVVANISALLAEVRESQTRYQPDTGQGQPGEEIP